MTTNATVPMAGRAWTADEEALLLTTTDAAFAKATGRTEGAANSRRRKLGLPNSRRTFGPDGANVTPEAAKALTNCVNALQRVVTDAAIRAARARAGAGGEIPVIQRADVDAVRGELFAVLLRGLPKGAGGPTAAAMRQAAGGGGVPQEKGVRRRGARVTSVGI
ncbi:hypothetical protein [Alienimonas sp. DA493]|uniref:hypothetical protein n=1 Tax=Alienimonas sp. DA493 TaxID=3373605 RepID=UPI003754519F